MKSKFFITLILHALLLSLSASAQARLLIMIEGVVGAGKSTLLNILAHKISDICTISEPFDRWQNVNNQGNLFKTFLEDQSRWALTFQNFAFLTHLQAIEDAYKNHPDLQIFITDRSHFSGMYIFTKMLFEKSFITPLEWEIYQESMQWYVEHLSCKPDAFIYLKTLPTTACGRANKRNRELNLSLKLDYFESLHNLHEDWLIRKNNVCRALVDVPILVLDGEVDFANNIVEQQKIISQIQDLIQFLNVRACF